MELYLGRPLSRLNFGFRSFKVGLNCIPGVFFCRREEAGNRLAWLRELFPYLRLSLVLDSALIFSTVSFLGTSWTYLNEFNYDVELTVNRFLVGGK
jgi:hypothetical protein